MLVEYHTWSLFTLYKTSMDLFCTAELISLVHIFHVYIWNLACSCFNTSNLLPIQVLEQLSGQSPVFSKGKSILNLTFASILYLASPAFYYILLSDANSISLILQLGTLCVLLVSGVMRRSPATWQWGVRRPCNCWRAGWRSRSTSCSGGISVTLDALDLVSKSTSISASSKFFYFYTFSICSLWCMQIYDCNFGLLLAALSLSVLSSRFCQHYLSVL